MRAMLPPRLTRGRASTRSSRDEQAFRSRRRPT
jgi:hypothetical protein